MDSLTTKTDNPNNRNPEGRRPSCTAEQVSAALQAADGNLTAAASALQISRQSVYNYISRYELQDVLDQSREKMGDEAVGQLHRLVREGNLGAVIFYLKTQHKARGYVERQEQTGADGEAIEYRAVRTEARPRLEDLRKALSPNRVTHLLEDDE